MKQFVQLREEEFSVGYHLLLHLLESFVETREENKRDCVLKNAYTRKYIFAINLNYGQYLFCLPANVSSF